MSECAQIMKLIDAHLDGELDVKETLRVDMHLQECEDCRENFLADRALHDLVRQQTIVPRAPEFARHCLTAALDREVRRSASRRRSRWAIPAAAATALATVGVILLFLAGRTPQVPPLVQLAVQHHVAYVQDPASLAVASDDPEAVAHWLQGQLEFPVGIPRDAPAEIALVGGGVATNATTKAAHLVYRLGDQPVSLLMTIPQEIPLNGRDMISFRNILFHPADVSGYHTLEWSDSRHTYVLVSSSPRAVYKACLVCHGSGAGRDLVAGFHRGI